MFNHTCHVITTAILADFVADFLTSISVPNKTTITTMKTVFHNTFLSELEKLLLYSATSLKIELLYSDLFCQVSLEPYVPMRPDLVKM